MTRITSERARPGWLRRIIDPMSLRNTIVLVGLTVAGACGSVTDPMAGDDMPPPPPDTTAPTLVSSTPADAGTKVGILGNLTFVMSESLDPATVNTEAVKVTYLQYGTALRTVRGTVAYDDATHTITFTPQLPLNVSQRYQIHLGATIKDVAGNAFAGDDLAFLTSINAQTRQVSYNSSTGVVSGWTGYTLDANGFLSKYLYHGSAGPDTIWLNADDPVTSRYDYVYSANGDILENRYFTAGPDTIWNTNDDQISNLYKYAYDSMGRQTEQTSATAAGPDAMWGTADDVLSSWSATTYTATGYRNVYYNNAGTDGIWKTADDKSGSYSDVTLSATGNATKYSNFQTGPDQIPNTSDDVQTSYTEYTFDANDAPTGYRGCSNKGPDMLWGTADDVFNYRYVYEVDGNGLQTGFSGYAAGPDGLFFTADDIVNYRQAFTYAANKLRTSATYFNGAGPDNVYNTSDDVIGNYVTDTYDQSGNRTDTKGYANPGADNVWKTSDDRLYYDSDYDLSH